MNRDALGLSPSTGRARYWLYGLGLVGTLNLALGLALALWQARRAGDLWTISNWCHQWLSEGVNVYGSATAPDYPPNAIVTYAVLAIIPGRWLVVVWAITTLALTPLLPYGVLRLTSRTCPPAGWVGPLVLFLCWGGVRTLLQFSQLSLLLACVAFVIPDHWVVGGTSLGLALAKPHIAGPMALWAACTGRFRMVAVAATVVVAEYGVYCLHAGVTPLQPIASWIGALRDLYVGADALNGYTSLRPWVLAAVANGTAADILWVVTGVATLFALCVAAVRDRTATLAIPGLLCLWSLLLIYHNLNNLILMLPAFIFLLNANDAETRSGRTWAVASIQVAFMLDMPVRFRDLAGGAFAPFLLNADRVVVLGTFVLVAWQWWRLQRTAMTGMAAGSRPVVPTLVTRREEPHST